jgi:uncharacterized protein
LGSDEYKLTFFEDNQIAIITIIRKKTNNKIISSQTIFSELDKKKFAHLKSKKEIDQKIWNFMKSKEAELKIRIFSDNLSEILTNSSVRITDDEMKAYLSMTAGPGLSGKITTVLLQRVLKNAGVIKGMMFDELDDITATLNAKPGYMKEILVAQGETEVFASDGQIVLSEQFNSATELNNTGKNRGISTGFTVRYDDVLVKVLPGQKGMEGITVKGKKTWSKDNSKIYKTPTVTISRNVKEIVSPSMIEYKAECDGRAFFLKNSIIDLVEIVNSRLILKISKDNLTCTLQLYGPMGGTPLNYSMVQKLIEKRGIVGAIPLEDIEKLIHELNDENNAGNRDIIIALGVPPVHGKDEDIEWYVNIEYVYVPQVDDSGSVNYKTGRTQPFIRKGEIAGMLRTATKAEEDGTDVFGSSIAAKDGISLELDWQDYFEQKKREKEGIEYISLIAVISGLVQKEKNKITIIPVFETITVDYTCGNINFDGSVIIKDSISDGFEVKATGDVHVKGSVGACLIESGGSVIISGGMNGRKKGLIKAKNDIIIKFAENCSLFSARNILVESHILLSSIVSLDRILVGKQKKNGKIIGSQVCALKSITVNQIGSHTAEDSMIWVGIRKNVYDAYIKYLEMEKKVQNILASIQIQLTESQQSSSKKSSLLIQKKNEFLEKQNYIQEKKNKYFEKSFIKDKSEIVVLNNVKENTILRIAEAELELLGSKQKVIFTLKDSVISYNDIKK